MNTEEMKANGDGGGDSLDLPPTLPNLPVKGVRIRTSTSSQRNAWEGKFNDLVSLRTLLLLRDMDCSLFPSLICSFLAPFFSLSSSSIMVIAMYRKLMHQIPSLGYG